MPTQTSGRRAIARHSLIRKAPAQEYDQARAHNHSASSHASVARALQPSNPVLELQKSAGNRATARALLAIGHRVGGAQIMRYPSGVLEQPLKDKDWKKYTKSVSKSDEGVSGGVYFFGSKRGPVKQVVVKPEAYGDAKDKNVAKDLLASAGIPVPKGRIVDRGSREWHDIILAARRAAGVDLTQDGSTDFVEVMSTVSGSSLSKTAKKAANGATPEDLAENINQLVVLLSTANVREQLASMMVRDAIAGNVDRIMKQGLSNIGNIMIKKGNDTKALPRAVQSRITAIDSEGTTSEFAKNKQRDFYIYLTDLGKNPALFVDRFLESIVFFLDKTNPQAGAMFTSHEKYGALREDLWHP